MSRGDLLVEAADRWGTPLYVTDLDAASASAGAWQHAVPGALVAYAVKANPDPALLRRLAQDGIGAEVVGPVELALAIRAGIVPERIVVNGVGQTDADLVAAAASGALVNAESLGALDALLAADGARIGLRVNPGLAASTHPHLATGTEEAKFGISLGEVAEARQRLRAAGVALESVGAHIGSAIDDPTPFGELAARMMALAHDLGAQRIDLGGGFAGAPAAWAASVLPHIGEPSRLVIEPGRSIVRDAGWLVTRVVRVHGRGHIVVDAGMTELLRPMLYDAQHPIELLRAGARLPHGGPWTLSGPICEAGDVLARDLDLGTDAGEGAVLAIGEAGAYGLAMTSSYNGRLRPAQVVIEGDRLRLSRRRETLEDVIARDEDVAAG